MKMKTVDEILDFAIEKEEDAAHFYKDLAARMDKPHMKKIFEGFSREEEGHKTKLKKVKAGKLAMPVGKKVIDLKIGDHLMDIEMDAALDFQNALILAMKAEKAAFRLYSDLAEATDDEKAKKMFLALAQEEARHKLRFEIEYDDYVYRGN